MSANDDDDEEGGSKPASDAPEEDAKPAKPTNSSDPKVKVKVNAPEEKPPKEMSQSAKRRAALPTPLDGFNVIEASWGYPAFARDFPRHPDLDALVGAYSRGDYARVREGAPKLAASTTDERIKRAAETLRTRIEPDPTSRIIFIFAALLLAFLTFWWVKHNGPEGGVPQSTSPKPAKSVPTVEHVD